MSNSNSDPYHLRSRLMRLIDVWFTQLEQDDYRLASPKDLQLAIQHVGMYLTRDIKIRAADDTGLTGAGSAVRKYAGAFRSNVAPAAPHAGRGAKGSARPALVAPEPDSDDTDAAD